MTAADSPPAGTNSVSPSACNSLPAQKRDPATGRAVIDYRAVAALALPLMLNSSLQAVISLTDTWFVGHISTAAMAGMAAVYWVVLLFLMLVGGVGLAVQTFVAQAEGGRRFTRASHATWVALTASALTLPFFALLAWSGPLLFAPFGSTWVALVLAVLLSVPRCLVFTVMATLLTAPTARLPIEQVTVLVPLQVPCAGTALTKLTLAGSLSDSVTPEAAAGFWLVTVTV